MVEVDVAYERRTAHGEMRSTLVTWVLVTVSSMQWVHRVMFSIQTQPESTHVLT